jgi:hypothetical protein
MAADPSPPTAPADEPGDLAGRARLLDKILRSADVDAQTLDRDEFQAAWLEAGAQLWPGRIAGTRPASRPAPEVWPPAPDLAPAPRPAAPCSGRGDIACTDPGAEATAPRLFARRLELRTLLGTGKCGETWRAHHHILGRDVAVKVLPRALARTPVLADLCREAMALDKLQHAAFPRIYECDYNDDGAWYLVEELIDGEPLAKTIQRGPMEPLQAIELMIPIAEALRDAHGRGIIHGDISALNLMLERSLPPRARIIDLSECRFQDAFFAAADQRYAMTPRHHGDSGRVCGHPAFAAPELFKGGAKSERADIYSLGAVLFMLLTGAQNPNPVIRELLTADDDGTRLRERLVEAVPELGETFIAGDLLEVLALDPARRTASMSAVLDMLCAERDALKELRNQDRSAATAARAAARELPRAARPASRDMSSRPSHWASAAVALAIAAPLLGVSVWWTLTQGDRTPPPIAAAAPPIERPAAPPPAAPTPAAVTPPKPTLAVSKDQVERAVEVAGDLLRACPGSTDLPYVYLTVGVGEATELIHINHSAPKRDNLFDRCAQDIVEKLHFPRSRPVLHSVRLDLGKPLE